MTTKKDDGLIDPDNVPSTYLADCLGMTPVSVSRLVAAKTIKNNGRRGKYRLVDAIPAYIASIRGSGKAEADARLKVQQTRKLELQNDTAAGVLVKIPNAAEAFRQGCLAWRAGASALPRRLATMLANQKDPAKIQKVLTSEFAELHEAMEAPLRKYFADAGQAFTVVATGSNGASPAPKKNARPVGRRKKNTATRKRRTRKVAKR